MLNQLLKYINLSTAQAIVFVLFVVLLIKLQLVIRKTESQLDQEKVRANYLARTLDSVEIYAKKKIEGIEVNLVQISKDSVVKVKRPQEKILQVIKLVDTTNAPSITKLPPKLDSVKVTFYFSGNYEKRVEVNKLFSIEKIELMLALSRYDSLYEYTPYLGLTKWKLIFHQRSKERNADIISIFRIGNATVENNRTIVCQFIEELHDNTFTKSARVVNFKGNIADSGIIGELSWIDKTYGRLVPLKVPITVVRD